MIDCHGPGRGSAWPGLLSTIQFMCKTILAPILLSWQQFRFTGLLGSGRSCRLCKRRRLDKLAFVIEGVVQDIVVPACTAGKS